MSEVSAYPDLADALEEFQRDWDKIREETIGALDDLRLAVEGVEDAFFEVDQALDAALEEEEV